MSDLAEVEGLVRPAVEASAEASVGAWEDLPLWVGVEVEV